MPFCVCVYVCVRTTIQNNKHLSRKYPAITAYCTSIRISHISLSMSLSFSKHKAKFSFWEYHQLLKGILFNLLLSLKSPPPGIDCTVEGEKGQKSPKASSKGRVLTVLGNFDIFAKNSA